MDYNALKTELEKPEYDGRNDAAILDLLNDGRMDEWNAIEKKTVNNHIIANSLNLKLRAVTLMPPDPSGIDAPQPAAGGLSVRLAAMGGLDFLLTDSGDLVDPNHPTTRGMIELLAGSGVFSSDEVEAFWALFRTPVEVTQLDIDRARLQPKVLQLQALHQRFARATNETGSTLAKLSEKLNKGEDVPLPTWDDVAQVFGETE